MSVRVVVLGATGFVGAQVLRALHRACPEAKVRVLVRGAPPELPANVEPVRGALPEALPAQLFFPEPHVVVHLATKQIDADGTGFEAVNVAGTARLLAQLPPSCAGVLYGSSMSVYGQGEQEGVREDAPVKPDTALARSRAEAERLLLAHGAGHGRSALVLRPRFVVGPGDRFTLPAFLKLARQRLGVGSGGQAYSIIDVRDYAKVIVELAARMLSDPAPHRGPLHVGYRRPVSFAEIAAVLRETFELAPARFRVPAPGPVARLLRRAGAGSLATKLELAGLSHHGDPSALAALLGPAVVERDPLPVLREAAAELREREEST